MAMSSTMSPFNHACGPSAPTYMPSPFLSSMRFMKKLWGESALYRVVSPWSLCEAPFSPERQEMNLH